MIAYKDVLLELMRYIMVFFAGLIATFYMAYQGQQLIDYSEKIFDEL